VQVKVLFAGEGATIPVLNIGLGFSGIKLWVGQPFVGYTTMTNQGFNGVSFLETPLLEIGEPDPETRRVFAELHGSNVRVKIIPTIFAIDGGSADITVSVRRNLGGQMKEFVISFTADNCRGVSVTAGAIEFDAELFQLPRDEWAPPEKALPL